MFSDADLVALRVTLQLAGLSTLILLVLGTEVLGRDHAAFSQTASLAALEEFERVSEESEINIDVAAPPRTF